MPAAPCRAAAQFRPRWEVADIFHLYGDDYRRRHKLPAAHRKVIHAIQVCRTEALGGHLQRCDCCGLEQPAFNSCRDRHCPKCGSHATEQWLQRQRAQLLPTGHFPLVFTIPHDLNRLILANQRILFNILFKAVSETLADFGRTHLHGKIGFLAVLHTWNQTLLDHFHLHCLIPGGALACDGSRWILARSNFLFHVTALSIVFRAKFLDLLMAAFENHQLQFPGQTASLQQAPQFHHLMTKLRKNRWVVYAKRPFSSAETVLEYLGRYTHRVAISNHRILSVDEGRVSFRYRDPNNPAQHRLMTLPAEEFIRRFLLHVLPASFQRIRHFGLLANRCKSENLRRCFQILSPGGVPNTTTGSPPIPARIACPVCHTGTMITVSILPPIRMDSS